MKNHNLDTGAKAQPIDTRDPVIITVDWHVAYIAPRLGPLLGPLLEFVEFSIASDNESGFEVQQTQHKCHNVDGRGQFQFPAGCVPRAKAELERFGFTVRINDVTKFGPGAKPLQRMLRGQPTASSELLTAAATHRRGVIEYGTEADMLAGVVSICQLYANARTMIVAKNRRQEAAIHQRLSMALNGKVHTRRQWQFGAANRRLVNTLQWVDHFNPDDWDLLILPAAVETLTPAHMAALQRTIDKAVFGFVPAGTRLTRQMTLGLEIVCGPTIAGPPKKRLAEQVTPNVLWTMPPPCTPVPETLTALETKRITCWANHARNDFIATITGSFGRGQGAEVGRAAGWIEPSVRSAVWDEPASVAILVESCEHARHLQERLRGWQVFDAKPSALPTTGWGGFAVDRDSLDSANCRTAIVTVSRAQKWRRFQIDVLIRADAGTEPPELPGFPPPDHIGEVIVVDLADQGNSLALGASQCRAAHYRQRGWRILSEPKWLTTQC